ncbi:TonB-dependent receptor [Sphingobium sp. 10 DY56-G10]|uniref:TonB-dependent receptor n=1 Tax=Sphingobium sp. 10 DY56-G10 TaxID=2974918 RepID=UPI00352A6A7B
MKHQFHTSAAIIALTGASILMAAQASAQTDGAPAQAEQPAADQSGLGDIIVTAQKREQRLNDVGVSVSVASATQLQSAGVIDAEGLGSIVPGFTASTSVFGPPVFSLRGVNFNSFQASAPPTVSSYIDEAALPYPVMGQALFLDVERVEVLKGPQGTLFGQNATGGSINVIAAKPTKDLSAGFRVDVNRWGETNAEGFVSGPLSDTLLARVAVQTTQFGGWQRGYYLNNQKNGDQNKIAGRLLLDWTPTDRLKISVNLNASKDRSEQQQAQAFLIQPVNPAAASAAPFLTYRDHLPTNARDTDFDTGYDTRADSYTYQGVLRADYDINEALTLTSITNYVKTRFRSPHDQDGTAVPMQPATAKADIKSINQEIRLSGNYADAGINFVLGASYGKDDITEGVANAYTGYTGFPANSPAEWKYDLTQRGAAIFGSVDYEVVQGLTLTAGARYTETKQTINGCTFDKGGTPGIRGVSQSIVGAVNPALAAAYVSGGCITIDDGGGAAAPTFLPIFADGEQKEHNIAWRGAVNYKVTPDVLLYASVSRGFKAGTFPVIVNLFNSVIKPVKQEKLTSYEAGAKLTLFDNHVQLNASAFHYDYVNKQFFSFLPVLQGALVTATLVNIPKSTVDGADIDITAQFGGLRLNGGATYIKTKVSQYVGFDFAGQPLDFSGKQFNYAPPWSANLDAEYKFDTGGDLSPFVGGTVTYRDKTFADLGEGADFAMPSYTLLDARIGVESINGWRLSLYGRNLTNKYYWNSVASAGDGAVRFTGEPRTYGANFSYRF